MTTRTETTPSEIFEKALRNLKLEDDRKNLLDNIATQIATLIQDEGLVNINFICTHNSRRSQFSQTWAYFAMEYYKINNGNAFSSGTAVTAFHANTVKALETCGFKFSLEEFSHQNPKYIISYEGHEKSILGFSKLVEDEHNNTPFVAITTCGHADENCPFIPTAIKRFHLPYIDPKGSDGTPEQDEAYLKTSKLIAGELGYLFKKVKESI